MKASILRNSLFFITLSILFGTIPFAKARVSSGSVSSCLKKGCSSVRSMGVSRANTLRARCMPGRALYSCHLVSGAADFKVNWNSRCLARARACGRRFGGFKKYPGNRNVHIGPLECKSQTRRLRMPRGCLAKKKGRRVGRRKGKNRRVRGRRRSKRRSRRSAR